MDKKKERERERGRNSDRERERERERKSFKDILAITTSDADMKILHTDQLMQFQIFAFGPILSFDVKSVIA